MDFTSLKSQHCPSPKEEAPLPNNTQKTPFIKPILPRPAQPVTAQTSPRSGKAVAVICGIITILISHQLIGAHCFTQNWVSCVCAHGLRCGLGWPWAGSTASALGTTGGSACSSRGGLCRWAAPTPQPRAHRVASPQLHLCDSALSLPEQGVRTEALSFTRSTGGQGGGREENGRDDPAQGCPESRSPGWGRTVSKAVTPPGTRREHRGEMRPPCP